MKSIKKIIIIALATAVLLLGIYFIIDSDYVNKLSYIDGFNAESNENVAHMFVNNDSMPVPEVYETVKLDSPAYSIEGYSFKPIQMAVTEGGYYVACTTNLASEGPGYCVFYLEVDGIMLRNDAVAYYTHGMFGNVVELVFVEESPVYENIVMIIEINENTIRIPTLTSER